MRPRVLVCGLIAAGLAALPAACGDDDGIADPSRKPTIGQVKIEGPDTLAPDQSAQYAAIAIYLDGTRAPAPEVQWASSSSHIRISATGLAVASSEVGESLLSASVPVMESRTGRRNGYKELVVVPTGTYRVTGTITEAGQTDTPIVEAHVEVSGTSIRVPTDWAGHYGAYGVPPDATLTVIREGYQSQTRPLHLSRHSVENFSLALSRPRLGLSGDYTVTFESGPPCPGSTPLRDDLRQREYSATLSQIGAEVTVQLTGAEFLVKDSRGDRFTGRADSVGAAFHLEDAFVSYYYYSATYPNVIERLADGSFLLTFGDGYPRGSESAMSGTLTGQMRHVRAGFPNTYNVEGCALTTRMSLNRR